MLFFLHFDKLSLCRKILPENPSNLFLLLNNPIHLLKTLFALCRLFKMENTEIHIDILSNVLKHVQLRGAVFFYVACHGNWVAATASAKTIAASLMPNAGHILEYHLLAKGSGWAAVIGQQPVKLSQGDIVLFPQGDEHVLSNAPDAKMNTHQSSSNPLPHSLPLAVSFVQGKPIMGELKNAATADAVLVCGFITCDASPFNPLLSSLPRMLHYSPDPRTSWIPDLLRHATMESENKKPGTDAFLARMSEMLFVDAVRNYLSQQTSVEHGWLAGLNDRFVGKALSEIHAAPAKSWTVEELAKEVGLSRSSFHDRFLQFIGVPPMQYLMQWRMQLAASILRSSHYSIAQVAQEIGYDSEAAFARAFKRLTGSPPAQWRKQQKSAL